jgi:hypothetical protein
VAAATAALASSRTSSANAACAASPNANVAVAHAASRLFLMMLSSNVIAFLPFTRIGGRSDFADFRQAAIGCKFISFFAFPTIDLISAQIGKTG